VRARQASEIERSILNLESKPGMVVSLEIQTPGNMIYSLGVERGAIEDSS
jgi:hypothetical protein